MESEYREQITEAFEFGSGNAEAGRWNAEGGRGEGWKANTRGSWEAIKLGGGRKILRMLKNGQNYIRERRSPPSGAMSIFSCPKSCTLAC
jgi:hypothetical protein